MPRLTLVRLAAVALTAASPTPAQADTDWSRFRGPNGSGVADAEDLPVEFGPDENVVWKLDLPPGHSSPVIWKDRLFVTAVDGETLLTLCIDRHEGEIVWKRKAPKSDVKVVDRRNNAASPSAAVDADTVVVFFPTCGMLGYDHDGRERWQRPLGPFDNIYGMGASPVLVANRAFLACDQSTDSFLIAVDKLTGDVAWRTDRAYAKSGHCTPIVYEPEGKPAQLILPGSFYLDGYDTTSGERVWWVRGPSWEMKSVPVLHDGLVLINGYGSPQNDVGRQLEVPAFEQADENGDGAIVPDEMGRSRARRFFGAVDLDADKKLDAGEWGYLRAVLASTNGMLAIRPGGEGDVTDESYAWKYHRKIPQLPSPLVYHDVLYMLHDQGGILVTFEPDTGKVLNDGRLKEGAGHNFYASPIAGDDKVYITSLEGLIWVLPAGGSYEPLAMNDLGEMCYATPAIVGSHLYVRTDQALYCFGKKG